MRVLWGRMYGNMWGNEPEQCCGGMGEICMHLRDVEVRHSWVDCGQHGERWNVSG